MRRLWADESSNSLGALGPALSRLRDLVLGEKLAHGLVLTFGSTTPQMHMLNTAVDPLLASLEVHRELIAHAVVKYQGISGTTPSKSALRVFSLVLRRLTPVESDARATLSDICKEARALNLISPADKDWKREMTLMLADRPVRLSLSLTPISTFTKLTIQCLNTDVPKEEEKNNYAYHLTLEPDVATESRSLRQLKQTGRQLVTALGMGAPTLGVSFAAAVNEFSLAGFVGAVVPTVTASIALVRYLSSRRLVSLTNH